MPSAVFLFCQKQNKKLLSLKEILIPDFNNFLFEDEQDYKGIPTGQDYLDEDGEIISYQEISKEEHPDRLKYSANNHNILISSLKGAKSPALNFNYDISNFVFSNGFYVFKVNNNWNLKFILYILRTQKLRNVLDNNIYRGIGISAYKLKDLLKIKIPEMSKDIQNKTVKQIEPIENRIKELKKQIKQPVDVVNIVFCREFGFDYEKFENLKKEKINISDFSNFGNNRDLRNSFKFHNKAVKYVTDYLKSLTTKKVKDFLSEKIVLGASVSPQYYDEDGSFYYLSMASIKNWQFGDTDTKFISDEYAKDNQNKTVSKNDIIIARSGEGTIGKVALIQDDIDAIFCDFTMRVRLENYNPLFAYYYFRTDFFQYLIEIHKKGLGNNTNIFPSQIQEFPMLDLSLERQQKIVDEIKQELDEQEKIKLEIEKERKKIDEIIEKTINNV